MRSWLLVAGMVIVMAGCASDGGALRPPAEWQTTTSRPPPPTSAPPSETSPSGLVLSSPDFEPGDAAPIETTCAGSNVFPNLRWENVGELAVELAVSLSDQTDPEEPLLLWMMAGIDPTLDGLDAGLQPAGAFETLNDYGNPGYGSPCLENLTAGQRDLQFRLHVLETPSGIAPGSPGNQAWPEIQARAADSASLLMRIDAAP